MVRTKKIEMIAQGIDIATCNENTPYPPGYTSTTPHDTLDKNSPHLTAPKFALRYPRIFKALSCLHLSHGLDTPKYPLTVPDSTSTMSN